MGGDWQWRAGYASPIDREGTVAILQMSERQVPIDAHLSVERAGDRFVVTFESRSGGRDSGRARNTAYERGLALLLARLGQIGALIDEASVASSRTQHLDAASRRLALPVDGPLEIDEWAPEALRLELQRLMRTTAQSPTAKGPGSNEKRLRLVLDVGDAPVDLEMLRHLVTSGSGQATTAAKEPRPRRASDGGGQGYQADKHDRLAIEFRAMALTTEALERERWKVEDVSRRASYDLHARRGTTELHVEVKGLSGTAIDIIATKNEIALARTYDPTWLSVVTGIQVDRSSEIRRGIAGDLTWFRPWLVDEGVLEAETYRWKPGS